MSTARARRRAALLANPLSAAGGNYYATASSSRDDKRIGREVARQRPSLRLAQIALEDAVSATDADRGYVQCWVETEQRRYVVAELDEAGNWWARDLYSGCLVALQSPVRRGQAVAS